MGRITMALCAVLFSSVLWSADRDSLSRGKELYDRRCGGCHGLDNVKVGPGLRGIYGRPAGSASGFPYSDSLKGAHLVWDQATLDRWLADPESLVPDNDMAFRLGNADERAAIIAYLQKLSAKPGQQ